MIISRGSDSVGEWFFSSRLAQSPPQSAREAFDWTIAQVALILPILEEARLLFPSSTMVRLAATRLAAAPAKVTSEVKAWDDIRRVVGQVTAEWPGEIPVQVDVSGYGVVVEPGGERSLPDVVGITSFANGTSGSVVVGTWCDAWLPRDLRARAQPEICALNAPRLRSALEAIERAIGVAGWCDGRTNFSVCEGYSLQSHADDDGGPVDMFEYGYDESWIAIE